MYELIEHIGLTMFMKVTIACWNEMLIVLLLLILLLGIYRDKKEKGISRAEIPMSSEIIVFFVIVLIYNLCCVLDTIYNGTLFKASYFIMRFGVFGYYASGGVLTLFLLKVFKEHIADKLKVQVLDKLITAFRLVQIPMFLMLLSTPFTDIIYKINSENNYVRSWGYIVWQSVTIGTFLFIGTALIIYWKKIDKLFRKVVATAVFFPIIGFIGCSLTDTCLNNSMVAVTAVLIFLLHLQNKARAAIRNAYELERTRTLLAESRFSLEHSNNQMLMAQIQPHFINNSLMALRARCVSYPDIYESITNFSLYLRSHFEALGDAKVISFEQEMMNIEAYLALEKQNYKDRLKIEYDIECDDFKIPVLSVQPLVENAVQHGIGTYDEGGTVKIAAYRDNGKVIIEVCDDGSGKNSITMQQKKRSGIGIENVRARLRSMSDGELEVITRENGTTARITINKCEEAMKNDDIIN